MKKNKLSKKITIVLLVGTIFLSFSFKSKFFEVAKQIEIYNTLFKELNMYYIDEINPAELTNKAIKNTLKDLDPYTNFYNEQDVEDARIRRAGEYGGIGVSVHYLKEGIQIREIYKGFSADKAGLKAGDLIISIDGQSIKNMERDQLSMLLKGTPNSKFSMQIERQQKVIQKEVLRDKIIINPVPFAEMINEETGYIILTRFNDKASSEVKKAFRKLKKEGMKKLVFDLRSNPGGSLRESINISNFFLPKGKTIVTTKAKIKKWSNTYKTTNAPLDLEIPIVVLVNGSSASASEIVSGSLQDYDRAVIMGKRSFGKGLVQRYRELTYGTQLKLTISKYYTPSGRCIQAIDYSSRNEDGSVGKIADSLRTEFTTRGGRKVYDGGGVKPDVEIEIKEYPSIIISLLRDHHIFNYANKFAYKHADIADPLTFEISDEIYADFVSYLKEQEYTYETHTEQAFELLEETAEGEEYLDAIKADIEALKQVYFTHKENDIEKYKTEIKEFLLDEIILRYYYRKGQLQVALENDLATQKAISLLQNETEYKAIIQP